MTEAPLTHFKRHRFPAEIIGHAVWLYYRFPLSFRDVEDLLAERGISVSFQTVSEWATKFGLKFAYQLRRRSRSEACRTKGSFPHSRHHERTVSSRSHSRR